MDRQRPRRHQPLRIAIVGAGRAGRSLAQALTRADYAIVSVSSHTLASAHALAALIPGARVGPPDQADLVLLTVPDSVIAEVASHIPWRPGQFAVHCAGSLGREVLAGIEATGAIAGAWHPLQSLARDDTSRFRGIRFAIDAPPALEAILDEMTRALGGVPLGIPPEGRVLYHLGATLVSNYAVTLVAIAAELWGEMAIDRAEAVAALAPLLAGTAANLGEVGLPGALTGPIARGDLSTIDRHLAALARTRPDLRPVYEILGQAALRLAVERGLSADRAAALKRRLDTVEATMVVAGGV
ncbi:MAG: DUF2520 domain-containing protein [Dehalococcoidia bacterium]